METLASSFLPKFPQLDVSSIQIDDNKPLTKLNITANSSFITFHPIKKLIRYTEKLNHNKPSTEEDVTLHKKKSQSLPETIFKSLDDFICTFMDLPLRPSIDPKQVLVGNFAAVEELPPTACEVVEGALPSCLDGAYIRNGPNPQFIPGGPYHLFDGDGMLHSIRISGGRATFCSRYVKTYKYVVERRLGYSIFPSVFSSFNGFSASMARCVLTVARVLAGQFSPMINGFGLANTSLGLFCGKLFALGESDLPYAVKITPDGDVITLGRHSFCSEPFLNMTAHPKIDPETGEVFAFGYNIQRPYLTYFRISPNGTKQRDVPIFSIEQRASFIHDFAVTKHYAIFPDLQIVMDPKEIMRGRSPVRIDLAKTPRLGIIPRYANNESEMRWIDVPGLNMLHAVNAWEEDDGDTIVVVASNVLSVEHAIDQMSLTYLSLEKIVIDAKAEKVVRRHPVSGKSLDFGVINSEYAGKKNRYVYAAVTAPMPKVAGVVKLDLSLSVAEGGDDRIVATRMYGPGCYGGEPFFVPREPDNPMAEEDDGYIVTYVHDENTEESKFVVMDAKSPNLDIVGVVMLPGRVPYGFHGIFVREKDLNML